MSTLKNLSHHQLLSQLHDLLLRDHTLETELIVHLGEVDSRRLYLEQACPSMFHYCVHVLHFAEGVAYKRIAVARAARRLPELLVALKKGDLHLTAASLLAPHLDRSCVAEWLAAARHKTVPEIKQWIADRRPKADVKTSVRKVPGVRSTGDAARSTAASDPVPTGVLGRPEKASHDELLAAGLRVAAPCEPTPDALFAAAAAAAAPAVPVVSTDSSRKAKASSEPLGADRYLVRFTLDAVVHAELQELRALLRHQIPDGDVAKIVGRALHSLLEQARKQKRGAPSSPRSARSPQASPRSGRGSSSPAGSASKRPSRKIPVAIRRAVWERDEGQCSYSSRAGRRCGTCEFLEFHHEVPWARCREHRASNIHLRCRAHNQFAAALDFGAEHMAVYRKRGGVATGEADLGEQPTRDSNWI